MERRLHPVSWLFTLWAELRRFAFPAIVLILAARWSLSDLFWLPLIVPILILAVVRQWSLRYTLDEQDLIIRRRLLFYRSERHIPYNRIHNLRIIETPLHRMLDVVEVVVETAAGREPEATLRVLSRAGLTELRAHVAARSDALASAADLRTDATGAELAGGSSTDMQAPAVTRQVVLAFSLRDAAMYGALDNRGFVIVGALVGVAWEALASYEGGQPWEPQYWRTYGRFVRSGWRWLSGTPAMESPLTLVAIAAAALAVLKLFSIGWAIVNLYGFRVERARTSLSVTHGLFTRASTVIPLHRIQQIKLREKPLHRLMRRVEIELATVGSTEGTGQKQPVWLAPIAVREAVPRLLAEVDAPVALDDIAWQPVHPRAGKRLRTRALIVMLVVGFGAWTISRHPWSILATAAAVPLALGAATMQARRLGYAVMSPLVVIRSGWLWRTIQITWVDRVQALAVSASPFDRRHRMATLIVDTAAGGAMGADLRVPYLPEATARTMQDRLAANVAATRFQW
jgi:putative membrane protein